jgi:hypothetical protein
MAYRMYGAFIASIGLVTLIFSTSASFGGSPAIAVPGRGAASAHPAFRPHMAGRSLQNHRRRDNGTGFWWATEGYSDPSYVPPSGDGAQQPVSGDVRYTYTQDVPWDAIHRFPPMVAPSDRPYVSECPTQTVTVPGRSGKDQDVNITRCY